MGKRMKKHTVTYIQRAAEILKCADEYVDECRREKNAHDWRVLDILRRYEGYRRGSGSVRDCPSPKEVSWALEEVIREYKGRFNDGLALPKQNMF